MTIYRLIFSCLFICGLNACGGESDTDSEQPDSPPVTETPNEPPVAATPVPTATPEMTPTVSPEPEPEDPNTTCTAISVMPTTSGCNGLVLTDEAAQIEKTPNLSVTTDENGDEIFNFNEEQSITLKNDGCYQFGEEGDSFSLAFWLKIEERTGSRSNQYIMGNRKAFTSDQGFFIHVGVHEDGNAILETNSKSGSARAVFAQSEIFNTGEWTHIVVSYNSANQKFTLHTNTKSTIGNAANNIFNPDKNFIIGGRGNIDDGSFQLSGLTFYDQPLRDSQINTLYFASPKSTPATVDLNDIIDSLNKHISGDVVLTDDQLTQLTDDFIDNDRVMTQNESYIRNTLALIENFDSTRGALFTTPETKGGFLRADNGDGLLLQRNIFRIQQAAHNQIFSESVLSNSACRNLLEGTVFASVNFFPGAVAPPEDPNVSYDINVDATVNKYQGMKVAFATDDARRPTGKYLAPGSIAKVTVPANMVNAGFSVLVGAHTIDHSSKGNLRRFDRIFSEYPISETETFVSNPFGGGIYINVPPLSNLGIQEISIQNVLQAPFYSTKAENKTTLALWQQYRQSKAPWADFETSNFMMQVPTNWIYKMDNPQSLMEEWESVMNGMTELKGLTPEQRNRKVLYVQVDARKANDGFNGIGYPQVNIAYNPEHDEQGQSDHHLLTAPGASSTMIHELTHAEQIFGFGGSEIEAIAYFPAVYIRMEKLGMSYEEAVGHGSDYDGNQAAINWMVTPNFRNGLEMDRSGNLSDETRYQRRGFMKHVDIAMLFGWDTTKAFYREMNDNADAGLSNDIEGLSFTDSFMFRYSKKAGVDLRPLFHFWGRHPDNQDALASKLAESNLKLSTIVREHLEYYADIAPKNNAEFSVHHEIIYPGKPFSPGEYGRAMYAELEESFDEASNTQIQSTIQDIIDLYY